MRLFKIENKGLRFLAGITVMTVIAAIAFFTFWVIGWGLLLLDGKFLGGNMAKIFWATNAFWTAFFGYMFVLLIFFISFLIIVFVKASKVLGNKFFNNSV